MEKKEFTRDQFEIHQTSDNLFIIKIRLHLSTKVTKGCLWWKEKTVEKVDHLVSFGEIDTERSCMEVGRIYYNEYSTVNDAIKWIDDYFKYPIIHKY